MNCKADRIASLLDGCGQRNCNPNAGDIPWPYLVSAQDSAASTRAMGKIGLNYLQTSLLLYDAGEQYSAEPRQQRPSMKSSLKRNAVGNTMKNYDYVFVA